MNVTCENCKSKFRFPDEKVPAKGVKNLKCPKCKSSIVIGPGKKSQGRKKTSKTGKSIEAAPSSVVASDENDDGRDESAAAGFGFEEQSDETAPLEDTGFDIAAGSDKPFDFMEEERDTALVCEPSKLLRRKIKHTLDLLEYQTTFTENARDALKTLMYHNFDLIVVNENFDTSNPDSNGVLVYVERLQMFTRRNIYMVMLTKRYRTLDSMMAFRKSVNLIVNMNNMNQFDKILANGLAEYRNFYRVYQETRKKLDKV
jgi:predicted Zn finger-like uncharacterized protein